MMPLDDKPASRLMLFSAYPLTREVIGRVAGSAAHGTVESVCLGELKRSSPVAIARALATMGGPELSLWIVVSDHNYQPYLNLMLLLASLVRARSDARIRLGPDSEPPMALISRMGRRVASVPCSD